MMNRPRHSQYSYSLIAALLVLLSGCAGMYFRDAGEAPLPPPRHSLLQWPYEECWTGIVFNGAKIGFTHLSLSPAQDAANRFQIRSEAVLHFRFLLYDKKVILRSYDLVADDLTLVSFAYDYDMDGNKLKLTGRRADSTLEVEIVSQDQAFNQMIPVEGKLYPASAIRLYPLLHGLELGRLYRYQVYSGETQSIVAVTQEILDYQESPGSKLFSGKAFKVRTRLHGLEMKTWIDAKGKPQLEISGNGMFISGLETEVMAKRYLAQAAMNKEEMLLDYSLIKTDLPIFEPERVDFMEVALQGIEEDLRIPNDRIQRCERSGEEIICRVSTQGFDDGCQNNGEGRSEAVFYLQSTHAVPSSHELIRKTAKEIAGHGETPRERMNMLVHWLQKNIERKPVDVFTALDVLVGRKAECQGHAYLYAALARSLEIPTRVVNGIVYSSAYQGFLYHAWAESLVDGRWLAVDPTLGQLPADATHVKFIEGESTLELFPLVNLIGRLQARIISLDSP